MGKIATLLVLVALLLNSCALPHILKERMDMLANDKQLEGRRWEQILDALKSRDKAAIKAMFSKQALDEAVDIDRGLDYIFEFMQGDIVSWETAVASSGSDSYDYGKMKKGYLSWGYVNTDQERYHVSFIDNTIDTEHPENVGLYMLQIIKAEDEETQFNWFTRCAGIYRPELADEQIELAKADKKIVDIRGDIQLKDKIAIKKRFSENALAESLSFDEDIDYMLSLIEGNFQSVEVGTGKVEESSEPGHMSKTVKYWCDVYTSEGQYLFFTVECVEDADHPENVGLYMLQVIKAEDQATQFDEGKEILCPGIYRPEKFADIIKRNEAALGGVEN